MPVLYEALELRKLASAELADFPGLHSSGKTDSSHWQSQEGTRGPCGHILLLTTRRKQKVDSGLR